MARLLHKEAKEKKSYAKLIISKTLYHFADEIFFDEVLIFSFSRYLQQA
jgi:hypothetical protein